MARQRLALEAKRGTDETFTFTAKDTAGDPVDLTGVNTFASTIKENMDSGSSLGSLVFEAAASDLPNGIVAARLDDALSSSLPELVYYEIGYIDAFANVRNIAFGTITIITS